MNFANGAQSPLSAAITAGATTLTVVSAVLFPAAPFHIVIDQELMTVTATAGSIFTVTRGIEGTPAVAHAKGALVTQTVTAGDFTNFANPPAGGGDRLFTLTNTPVAVSTTSSLGAYDTYYVCTAATAITVTLPAPVKGKGLGIIISLSSVNLVTVSGGGANIDGAASRVMFAGETAELYSFDGATWTKVAGKTIPMLATAALSANQNGIPTATGTVVTLDTSVLDNTGLMVNTGLHRITVRRAGQYQLIPAVRSDFIVTNNVPRWTSWARLNGNAGTFLNQSEISLLVGAAGMAANPGPLGFSAGDYVELVGFQTSGVNQNFAGNGTTGDSYMALAEYPSW